METSDTCCIANDGEGLPPKPEEPLSTDCCGSGCNPCVYDIYEEDLRKWEKECTGMAGSQDVDGNPVLSKSEFRLFRLDLIKRMSHDCWIYRFCIPDGRSLGLKTGQHLILR